MVNWINKKRNKKGFTLIELVVVIAILGILVAIAVPRFGGFSDKAQEQAEAASTRAMEAAAAMYFSENGAFPATVADLGAYLDDDIITNYGTSTIDSDGKVTVIDTTP